MTQKNFLTKKQAAEKALRDVCIDEDENIWVTVRVPPPSVLMEFESAGEDADNFAMINKVIRDGLVKPRLVESPSDNEDEITLDELGPYYLKVGMAIMEAADVSGEARKKAEAFLADEHGDDGGNGGKDIPHEAIVHTGA